MDRINKPTSAKPRTVEGVVFRCYRTGMLKTAWRSDDGRLEAGDNYHSTTYYAAVDGAGIGATPTSLRCKRFRSLENAMRAAVKAAKQP